MKDFFISYNSADRAWAEWIAWELEAAGYTTVLQAWDFRPGSNFVVKMHKSIEEVQRTIAVLSQNYLDSNFTPAEWAGAFAQDPTGEKGLLLPVRIVECELEGLLGQIVYIDLVGLPAEAAATRLLEGVYLQPDGNHRAKPANRPPFPTAVQQRPEFPGRLPITTERSHETVEEQVLTHEVLPSPPTPPNNLSHDLDSFIGREQEITKIKELVSLGHLVTLTGEGGIGKSRLAREIASSVLPLYEDGVYVIQLTALIDPDLIPQAIATQLGVLEEPGRPLTLTLIDYLRPKRLLLVLDNCEHLVANRAMAIITEELLGLCHRVTILVTSREALRAKGEQPYRVPPLAAPNPEEASLLDLEDLKQYAAIRLFVERVILDDGSTFEITEQNAKAIAELCYQLDGLPLAIELAAARLEDLLTVEQIAAQLTRRFELLDVGGRATLPRHQKMMWETIDWSYQLLSEPEQLLFNRLSVFVGGWTLEAATAVCQDDSIPTTGILNLLSNLRRKSLLQTKEQNGEPRYRFLQTIRDFGQVQLEQSGEASAMRRRRADYYLTLAKTAETNLMGAQQSSWLKRLEQEHDNLRAVLNWSQAVGGGEELGLQLAGAVWRFWLVRGYFNEGVTSIEMILKSASNVSASVRAKALFTAGSLVLSQHNYERAAELYQQSLKLYQAINDKQGIAWTCHDLGAVIRASGDSVTTASLFEQSLTLFQQLGDKVGTGWVLHDQGRSCWMRRDLDHAKQLHQESLTLLRDGGDTWGRACSLHGLGDVTRYQGNYEEALTYYKESISLFQDLGDLRGIAWSRRNAGASAHAQRNYEEAVSLYKISLNSFRDLGHKHGTAWSLHSLGNVARDQGDYAYATSYYTESLALFRDVGDKRGVAWTSHNLGNVSYDQGDYQQALVHYEESIKLFEELDDKQGVAWSLHNVGNVACDQGNHEHATRSYNQSLDMFRKVDHKNGIAWTFHGLGNAARSQSNYAYATSSYNESLKLLREQRDNRGIAWNMHGLGNVAYDQHDYDHATSSYTKSLAFFRDLGDQRGIIWTLHNLGSTAWKQGKYRRAARLLAIAERLREGLKTSLPATEQDMYEITCATLRSELGNGTFAEIWMKGRAMSREEAIAYALQPVATD